MVCFVCILTWKCAWRHNCVHFLNISIPKSVPKLRCFAHFKLRNVLPATAACAFSTSHLPKVLRRWCVLYVFTSKCVSSHNGVQFFISRLISEPTFRPSGAPNHWKNIVFRDFSTFFRFFLFSDLLFSSLIFSSLLWSSLTLPTSAFPSVHIVGSLTSKLRSVIILFHHY